MPRIRSSRERLKLIAARHQAQRDDILRWFSNREALIEAFEGVLSTPKGESLPVTMIYGIGGIGKTWFIRYAIEAICKPREIPYAFLDFREEMYQSAESALFFLRSDILRRYKYRFSRFDLVWAEYARKALGYVIKRGGLIPEELETLADLIDALELVPFVGEVAKAIKLVDLLGRKATDWFQNQFGEHWGRVLEEMEPTDLVDVMPIAFAEDLNGNIQRHSTRFVLFFDTFERIERSEGTFVRELAGVLEQIFLVIAGRNSLQWDEVDDEWADEAHLKQFLVGNFSELDTRQYLYQFDIVDEAMIEQLYQITEGHIQYLALAVDLIRTVRGKGEQVTRESLRIRAKEELLPQFLSELSGEERDVVQIAAVPRWFSEEVVEQLLGRPESTDRLMNKLVRYSFVEPRVEIEEAYRLHTTVRDLLLTSLQGKPFYRHCQAQLVWYFDTKAKETQGDKRLVYLVEQVHHEFNLDESQGYQHFRQLFEQALRFRHLSECRALLQSLPNALDDYHNKEIGLWVQKWRADLLRLEYRNKDAKTLYETLLPQAQDNKTLQAHILRGLGAVLRTLNLYKQGEECYQLGLEAARVSEDRQVEADLLRRFGGIYRIRGEEDVALQYFREALEITTVIKDFPSQALVLNALGRVAIKFGRWEDARHYFAEAASKWKTLGATVRETAPEQNWGVLEIRLGNLASAANNFRTHLVLGWQEGIWGRVESGLNNLGAIAYDYGHFDAAVLYRSQRLSIRRARGGRTTEAFAMRGKAICLVRSGEWDNAEDLLQKALRIYLDVNPTTSRLSGIHRNLARLYTLQDKLDEALKHAEEGWNIAATSSLSEKTSQPGETMINLES